MPDTARAADPLNNPSAWAAYGAFVTAAYLAAAIGGVGPRPAGGAAGAAVAALAVASAQRASLLSAVALGVLPLAVAASAGGKRGFELAAATALVAGLGWANSRSAAVLGVAGAALVALGVLIGRVSGDVAGFAVSPGTGALAACLLAGAAVALLAAATAFETPTPIVVLIVPALIAGFGAARGAAVQPRVAVAIGGMVAVAAVVANRPAAALAALSVAAAAGIDDPAIALLLAAAAVLVAPWPARPTGPVVLISLPALGGLAAAVTSNPSASAIGVGAFAALCVVVVTIGADSAAWTSTMAFPSALWPATALAAWLALAPQTWGWLGPVPTAVTTTSRGLVAAVGVVALVLVAGRRPWRTAGNQGLLRR